MYERDLVPMAATLADDSRCRIFQGDCFEWLRRYGDADYGGAANTTKTLFEIASTSKIFTAAALSLSISNET